MHESERVYGDGLATLEDCGRFRAILSSQAKRRFPANNVAPWVSSDNPLPLIFTHFAVVTHDKIYDQIEVRVD